QRFSPVTSTLRINPSVNYSIQFVTAYDVKFKQVTSIQLQSTLRDAGRWYSNITFAYSNPSPSVIDTGFPRIIYHAQDSVQTNAGIGLWKNRLVLNGEVSYDIDQKTLLN